MNPTSSPPGWRLPLYASVRTVHHVNSKRVRGCRVFRFYCLAHLFSTTGQTIRNLEIEYAAEEPYSFFPRNLFDLYQPATVGVVLPRAILRGNVACDQVRLRFDFNTADSGGVL